MSSLERAHEPAHPKPPGFEGSASPPANPGQEGRSGRPSTANGVASVEGSGHGGRTVETGRDPGSSLPRPGDRLGTFTVERAIGAGGMGAVFLARDDLLDRPVALKVLRKAPEGDSEPIVRFEREARAAARLDHENIARVYSIGEGLGFLFIAFEYIEGTTIRERVEALGGPLPVSEAINYAIQIAEALVHASARGVVHRDVKPSNVVITPRGRAKLVDMGLARRFEREGIDGGLTQTGTTLGSFDYISPEQARDPRDVDVRGDLYSLGCTLFHMLTGRPPFPEGTVLQKLLQHQEEPPPDPIALNPAVPASLSRIVLRLMEKDRDRRYQTPEALARDLVDLAAAIGLRPFPSNPPVWERPSEGKGWEPHLIWAIPALGLSLIVAALSWLGKPGTGLDAEEPIRPLVTAPTLDPPSPPGTTIADAGERPRIGDADTSPTPWRPPAVLVVDPAGDLVATMAGAPDGSTIVLAGNGPYDLKPAAPGAEATRGGRDLILRAAQGFRPVVRIDPNATLGRPDGGAELGLIVARGGSIRVEGIDFQLSGSATTPGASAILAVDAEVTLQDCRFRRLPDRSGQVGGPSSTAAVRLLASGSAADHADFRGLPFSATGCLFGGALVGIHASGPVDLHLRDCDFATQEHAVWLDDRNRVGITEGPGIVASDLRLEEARILAGSAPVFRFEGVSPRVRLEGSVVAPPGTSPATLLAVDRPSRLDWRGRDNVYGRIRTYLRPIGEQTTATSGTISSYASWAEDPSTIRETRSEAMTARPWASADPMAALAGADPSSAFTVEVAALPVALEPPPTTTGPAPSRPRPGGLLASLLETALASRPLDALRAGARRGLAAREPVGAEGDGSGSGSGAGNRLGTRSNPPGLGNLAGSTSGPLEEGGMDLLTAPMPIFRPFEDEDFADEPAGVRPMPIEPDSSRGRPLPFRPDLGGDEPTRNSGAGNEVPADDRGNLATSVRTPPSRLADGPLEPVRDSEGLSRAIRALGDRGGVVLLAPEARIEITGLEVPRFGRWTIRAAPGSGRPQIGYRPTTTFIVRSPALLRLAPGTLLDVEGVDFVVRTPSSGSRTPRALFEVAGGSELSLTRCTISLSPPDEGSAVSPPPVFAVLSPTDPTGDRPDAPAATVRISDSFLRAASDLVDVAPGSRIDLSATNSVLAAGAGLVHAHGTSRGTSPGPLQVSLRRVTARLEGGIAYMESGPGRPELPRIEVIARDSILATTADGAPLFRVDGQDSLEALRDRVRWEGRDVVYHLIDTYRRDQSALSGTAPVGIDRFSWEVAVGPREDRAVHGDARFRLDWPPSRPPWTAVIDDMRLGPEAPNPTAGPDLDLLPGPPDLGEL